MDTLPQHHHGRNTEQTMRLLGMLTLINKILRHDLRNRFTAVRYNLEAYDTEPDRTQLDDAYRAAGAGLELINEMRELEEALLVGDRPLVLTDMREVALKVAAHQSDKVTVTGSARAMVDPAIKSVLSNLVSNAFKHGCATVVEICLRETNDRVTVRVCDDGRGIPDETKGKLFVEGSSHGPAAGTGIGLYIVHETISRYGGTVHIEDNQPRGAVFVIELPAGK